VKEDTLLDMVSFMRDDVGLVHQMPFTCDRAGFPAILEKVSFSDGLMTFDVYHVTVCLHYIVWPHALALIINTDNTD